MTRIHRLQNRVQNYAWGSRTVIPELLGVASPAPEPWAELWMGAHPKAPSRVVTDSGGVDLDTFIARDPVAVLGAEVARRFGGELPFLFKVLAAEQPLSLQAHPNAQQARAGFARENEAGIPLDSDRRCYRDARHKPELICALTPFTALCGFRPLPELCAHLDALAAPELADCAARLREQGEAALAACMRVLWSLDPGSRQRVVGRAVACARDRDGAVWREVEKLAHAYPEDVGVLAPLLLNLIVLEPGEALMLEAGCLHSYLGGSGIELMANSDNVLRGGLTPKHVDVPALLETLVFRCGERPPLRPLALGGGEHRYPTDVEEFSLSRLNLVPGRPWQAPARRGVEILLCTDGAARCFDAAGTRLELPRGGSLLAPASAGPYRLEGDATLYRASLGASVLA